jgi:hypothetical protein
MVKTDSNSILKIVVILLVVGIAYLIYFLYNKSSSSTSEQSNVAPLQNSEPPSEIYYSSSRNELPPQSSSRNTQSQNISIKTGIKGSPSGLENPVLNKMNTLSGNNINGDNTIEHFSQNPEFQEERNESSFPKDQLTAQELLPQDNHSLWAQVNPEGAGSLKDKSFIQSGYHIGINTVGQTLRNANLQLRSEPPCPQVVVSPFLQSTITPDTSRRVFEVGNCN